MIIFVTKTGAKKPAATGKTATKPGVANKGKDAKTPQKSPAKPKKKEWTLEDKAATHIQAYVRMFLAKCKLHVARKQKKEYEEMMEKLEREVLVKHG